MEKIGEKSASYNSKGTVPAVNAPTRIKTCDTAQCKAINYKTFVFEKNIFFLIQCVVKQAEFKTKG